MKEITEHLNALNVLTKENSEVYSFYYDSVENRPVVHLSNELFNETFNQNEVVEETISGDNIHQRAVRDEVSFISVFDTSEV